MKKKQGEPDRSKAQSELSKEKYPFPLLQLSF